MKYPDISKSRLRYALRNRDTNGIGPYVRQTSWKGRPFMLEHAAVYAFLTATVPA